MRVAVRVLHSCAFIEFCKSPHSTLNSLVNSSSIISAENYNDVTVIIAGGFNVDFSRSKPNCSN